MDLLKDLRCSRSIMMDNMALAGVAGTSQTQHNNADCLAVRLQVRWRATEEDSSERERCCLAGGLAQPATCNDAYTSRRGHTVSGYCVGVSAVSAFFTALVSRAVEAA